MTAKASFTILQQTLAPVFLVIVFWVAMSLGTNYFIVSVENSNQKVFLENVTSTKAAKNLQIQIWKVAADFPSQPEHLAEFKSQWPAMKKTIEFEKNELSRTAYMEEEFAEIPKLGELCAKLEDLVDPVLEPQAEIRDVDLADRSHKIHEVTRQLHQSVQLMYDVNQAVVDQYRTHRKILNQRVVYARWSVLALGPVLGVLLGWRVGSRLHRSIARIAVTLHDVGSSADLGTVDIDSTGDFRNIERQAEQVAERMRNVSRELNVARSEVLQSERLAAVGGLAAGVAHEIRNPLTSVKLLLQHAVRNGASPNLNQSNIRLILEEIARMEKTIQGLLDFSRPPKLNRITHDFRQTLHRAINLIEARSRQQQIEIEARISDSPLMVDGDTEKLHQLLINLLINAVDAMPDGGLLSIDATLRPDWKERPSQSGQILSTDRRRQNVVEVIIKDTGEGISNDVLPRMFEPFATTKERGTGLGLAVSHRIVEEHGGTIHACNDPYGGARFTLTIPSVDVPAAVLCL